MRSTPRQPSVVVGQIKIELDQLHRPVGSQLTDNGKPGNKHPDRDEEAVVGSTGNQLGEFVESGGESVDDADQFEDLEVVRRGLPFGAAVRAKQPVEVLEEAGGCANDPSRFAHRL